MASLLNRRALLFAVNCYVAAMLAIGIALVFNLANPWWAAVTVFITSQPMAGAAGAVWARARYRLFGSVVGMVASLLIVPNLIDEPEIMMLVIAAWIALCVYLSLLDKSPRSYAFLLAGYTVALVGLPLVTDPSPIFDIAVLRTEEIAIGVLSAAVVHTLFFPRTVHAMVQARLASTLADAKRLMLGVLDGPSLDDSAATAGVAPATGPLASDAAAARRKIAADLSELDLLTRSLRFEARHPAGSARVIWALEARMVSLVPFLTSVEDRLGALRALGPLPAELRSVVSAAHGWIATDDADALHCDRVLDEARAALREPDASATWADVLVANLLTRLVEMMQAWRDILQLRDAAARPAHPVDAGLRTLLAAQRPRLMHIDHGLAAFSGLAAGIAVLATAGFAVEMDWVSGAAAVGITAAACSVFAFADDPSPFQKLFINATLLAVPAAALYVFAVFPLLDGFAMLAFALAPLYIATGVFLASPRYWLYGLGFALITQTLIGIQQAPQADFTVFTNIAIACIIGSVVALVVTLLIRVVGAELSARRILRAGWAELARLAVGRRPPGREEWASRMLDRQGLLVPRLASAGASADEQLRLSDALNDLRIGINVVSLRLARRSLAESAWPSVDAMLGRVGAHFDALRRGVNVKAADDLLAAIDASMASLLASAGGDARMQAIVASVGLRRNLFPRATPFEVTT